MAETKRKQQAEPKKRGRPSTYDEAVAGEICARIAEGEPLRAICREKGIAWRTVYEWLEAHADFAARFARARDVGMDAIAEEALEIADTTEEGVETEESEQGMKIKRGDMLGHRKLRIETRLKLLAKWNPKKYGDLLKLADPDAKAMQTNPVFNITVKGAKK